MRKSKLIITCLLSILLAGCNATEQEVEINNGSGQLRMLRVSGLELSPAFEITQKHYVLTAAFSVTKINLQAWTKKANDSVTINGLALDIRKDYRLAIGNNQFTIFVSNKEGVSERYQLTITRLPENNSNNKLIANGEG